MKRRGSRRRKARFEPISPSYWMITFSDLLTLLLTFFVMRVAMDTIDLARLERVLRPEAAEAQDQAESTNEVVIETLSGTFGPPRQSGSEGAVLEFGDDISVRPTDQGALLMLGSNTFDSASDRLSAEAREALAQLSTVLRGQSQAIDIAGHTDDVPIASERFASNWELSSARAIAVAREMLSAGVSPERISVVGYADTKPLEPNIDEAARAKNRRVEVLVKAEKR